LTDTGARQGLWLGLVCAIGAGLAWGLVFVAPVMLPGYPPLVLSAGRYLAFGLVALALAWHSRQALQQLSKADWIKAGWLSLIGNLVYYVFLAAAIQTAGVPMPTMLIGTLPVVIAVVSNLSDRALPWRRLAPSLAIILAGILLVNHTEIATLTGIGESARSARHGDESALSRHGLGAMLAMVAVVCWTWYPISNARWMQRNPEVSPSTWATAQGLTTLPLAIIAWGLALAVETVTPLASGASPTQFDFPLGPQAMHFVLLMTLLGLVSSWLGTRLWNEASRLLPTSLTGQLIVFETLAALAYGYAWRGDWPAPTAAVGIGLLIVGVAIGANAFRPR
jgi:drug/metabolite transporter (DMT)-like permease